MRDAGRGIEPGNIISAAVLLLADSEAGLAFEALIILAGPHEAEVRRVVAGKLELVRRRKAGDSARFARGDDGPMVNFVGSGGRLGVSGLRRAAIGRNERQGFPGRSVGNEARVIK